MSTDLPTPRPLVLVADDDSSVLNLIKFFLRELDCEVITATDGDEALAMAQERLPAVVLLDVMMPGRTGWEVCQALKAVQRTSGIRVILSTAKGDVRDRLTGLQVGADDYLVKPFNKDQVVNRVRAQLAFTVPEMEETPNLETRLYDRTTSLPTIPMLLDRAKELLIEQEQIGIVYIDIEQFDAIEAEYGWAFFDEFLHSVAEALIEQLAKIDKDAFIASAWVGASSFYVFLDRKECSNDQDDLEALALRLRDLLVSAIKTRFPQMHPEQIGFFVGAACISYQPQIRLERQIYHGMKDAADAVRDAEQQRKRSLGRELREIINRKRVTTLFQPIVQAKDGALFGYEVLTRGPRNSSFRNSDMLFSFARDNELAWELEAIALESALVRLRNSDLGNSKFLINLEAEMFEMSELRFHDIMKYFAEQRGHFVFELTERAAIADYNSFRTMLEDFRRQGIEIAIDDAGSGYASLEAIASLAPDYLKVTKGLVSTIATEPIKQDLVRLLVDLAQKIGAKTIAEGIETVEEHSWCRDLGIDLIQGYYIARPQESFVGDDTLSRRHRSGTGGAP